MSTAYECPSKSVQPLTHATAHIELDVVRMHESTMRYTFVHEIRHARDLRKAVEYARYRLMQEAQRLNYNILLVEG